VIKITIDLVNLCETTQFIGNVKSLSILKQRPEFQINNIIDLSNFDTLAGKLGVDCGGINFSVKP